MKRVLILTPLALAALAGCAPAPNQIKAGQWEIVTELRSVDMPGAPPELQRQVRSQIGRPDAAPLCLTDEQAHNFLQLTRQLLTQGQASSCTFTDEAYTGGRITQRATCPGPTGQARSSVSFEGTFSGTTFNGSVNAERPNPTGTNQNQIRLTASIRGRRLGDCPAAQPIGLPGAPPSGL